MADQHKTFEELAKDRAYKILVGDSEIVALKLEGFEATQVGAILGPTQMGGSYSKGKGSDWLVVVRKGGLVLPYEQWTNQVSGVIAEATGSEPSSISVTINPQLQSGERSDLEQGIRIDFEDTTAEIKVGRIEEIGDLDRNAGVVLPANTQFTDACISDKSSAMGSFFLTHFPEKIAAAKLAMKRQLKIDGYQKDSDGNYQVGTTIIMPQPFSAHTNILITASTNLETKTGFDAEPGNVGRCIRAILDKTSSTRISRIRMPILGSGRGKLELNSALYLLLLSIQHYVTRTSLRHVKLIDVVVHEKDARKLGDLDKSLAFLT